MLSLKQKFFGGGGRVSKIKIINSIDSFFTWQEFIYIVSGWSLFIFYLAGLYSYFKWLDVIHITWQEFIHIISGRSLFIFYLVGVYSYSLLSSSAVDCGFELPKGQTNNYQTDICCFPTKQAALSSKI